MINRYKYTDAEKKQLIDSLVVLVDTREHDGKNQHILDYFDKKGIKYKNKKLEVGDYSFFVPANESLNIPRDLYFDNEIILERKSSLSEISGNLTNDRARIEKEFAVAPRNKVLLIEEGSFEDIATNNYNTKYNRKSFLGSLITFWHRYNIPIFFMPNKEFTGLFIRLYFEYYLREQLH